MAKIFSILTLLAAGLALYLGLESGKRIKEMQTAGEKTKATLNRTENDLKSTKDTLKTTEENLAKTTSDLEGTRSKLATAEQEATKAKADLAAVNGELTKATADLAAIKKAIEDAIPGGLVEIGNLKTKMTELTDKLTSQEKQIADLQKEKGSLEQAVQALEAGKKDSEDKIATQGATIKRYKDNIMQKGIRGRVMAVNSGWGFAVLSVGDRQGAAANKVMIVARGGQGIGKVRITNVEATQSVADILPGTFTRGMYVQPGDDVIYTGDDKVKEEEAAPASSTTTPTPSGPATPAPALPQAN